MEIANAMLVIQIHPLKTKTFQCTIYTCTLIAKYQGSSKEIIRTNSLLEIANMYQVSYNIQ